MNPYSGYLEETGKSIHASWIFLGYIAFGLGMIASIIMIIMPMFLLFQGGDLRSLLWLGLIPVGLWILKQASQLLQSFMSKINNRRSQFMINSDELTYTIVGDDGEQTSSGVIPLSSIQHVVTSIYRLKNSHLYTNFFSDAKVRVSDFPILFIVFNDGATLRQIGITFYDETSIKKWLLFLQQYNIQLYYGFLDPHISQSNTDAFSEDLLDTEVLAPFKIKEASNWRWLAIKLRLEAHDSLSKAIAEESKNEESTQRETDVHLRQLALKRGQQQASSAPRLEKLTFNQWINTAIRTYLIICLGALVAIYLAQNDSIDYTGPSPGFIILFIASLVYFWSLRRQFRWFYMIFFCMESFVVFLLSTIFITGENTTPVIEEMISSLLASVIFFPLIIWLPYAIMSYVRKQITTLEQ